MQEQWSKNLGIKCELKGVTFDTFVVERPSRLPIARNAWGADYPHPDTFLRVLFQSESGNNDEGYNNPDSTTSMAQAGAEPDIDEVHRPLQPGPGDPRRRRSGGFHPLAHQNYEVRPWVPARRRPAGLGHRRPVPRTSRSSSTRERSAR